MLFGQSVAMRDKGAPAGQIQLGLTAEKLDPEITVEERPAPAIMIAAHERDRDAAGAYLLELGDGGKVFAGNDALILGFARKWTLLKRY